MWGGWWIRFETYHKYAYWIQSYVFYLIIIIIIIFFSFNFQYTLVLVDFKGGLIAWFSLNMQCYFCGDSLWIRQLLKVALFLLFFFISSSFPVVFIFLFQLTEELCLL